MQPPPPARSGESGFILLFALIMIMAVSAIGLAMVYDSKQTKVSAANHMNRIRSFYASDGMMALLADEILNGRDTLYTRNARKGTVTGTIWKTPGVGGIPAFRGRVRANSMGVGIPIRSSTLGSFLRDQGYEGDPQYKDEYGIRWCGFIYPPVSGPYTFFVKADDQSEFFLSTDESPANIGASPIAWNYQSMDAHGWPSFSNKPVGEAYNTVSGPRHLKGGKRYYFEFYHKENGGGDFGQVGWSGPDWLTEKPIPGFRLSPYDSLRLETVMDTFRIGGSPVRYSVEPIGQDVFNVSTEGFAAIPGRDTLYRAPLNQKISLKSANGKPPDTLWARVIFYDYRSDKSNPEFESPPWGIGGARAHEGILQSNRLRHTTVDAAYFRMDSIGKPIRSGNRSSQFYSCAVERWFDPWVKDAPGNKLVPRDRDGIPDDCDPVTVTVDTLFKNVRIYDSLPFAHQSDLGTNTYRFARTGGPADSGFFWIDDRGFGREGRPHNYSFCMEMHANFLHIPGLMFDFRGDDDVWLFIDDRLVMDLGGLHVSLPHTVYFDELGLADNRPHTFSFFYCERQTTDSHISITTNVQVGNSNGRLSKNWKRDYGDLD